MDTVATIEPSSTTLDTGAVSPSAAGGGMPRVPNEAPSVQDAVAAAVKEVKQPEPKEEAPAEKPDADVVPAKDAAKPDAKEPKEAKAEESSKDDKKAPERGEGGKFVAKEAKADAANETTPREADDKPHVTKFHEPPKNFQADSRDVWRNVPRPVQRDIDAMVRESEERETQYRETVQRYDRIRDFDDIARSNGRDLRESLERVNHVENLMQRNPLAGLNAILMEIGPRKPDGQPVSLYEVAQHIVQQGPEGYQRMVQQTPPQERQQQQPNPEVQALQQQIQEMQAQQLAAQVIEPFKADHPRYGELENDIAFFLKSGKIPQSLSHYDRLALAYDMAERINPPSRAEPANTDPGPGADARRADPDFSGSRSIRSAPGSVTPDEEPERGGSIREQLERAIRTQRRA